jgi:endonuclease YncB( thermonuclease family)
VKRRRVTEKGTLGWIPKTGIAGLLFVAMLIGWNAKPKEGTPYRVVEVVDGDTFFIANRQPIRLYGLDAPELENCFGPEAKQELERLIMGRDVELKEILSEGFGRRILAMVYVKGQLVNGQLIKNGFARYRGQGNTVTQTLKEAGENARKEKLGIFSPKCYQMSPPDSKCPIKGNIDHIKKTKFYYPPTCKIYNSVEVERYLGDEWFCNENEAKAAGYSLSATCN